MSSCLEKYILAIDILYCLRDGKRREIVLPVISKALPASVARRKTFRLLDFFANEVNFYNKVSVRK